MEVQVVLQTRTEISTEIRTVVLAEELMGMEMETLISETEMKQISISLVLGFGTLPLSGKMMMMLHLQSISHQ